MRRNKLRLLSIKKSLIFSAEGGLVILAKKLKICRRMSSCGLFLSATFFWEKKVAPETLLFPKIWDKMKM